MNEQEPNVNPGASDPREQPEGAEFTPGPTSPVTGPGGQAAARAAYAGASKRQSDARDTPDAAGAESEQALSADASEQEQPAADEAQNQAHDEGEPQDAKESNAEPQLDDSPESLAAAFENETSEREQELIDQLQRVSASYTNLESEYHAYVRRTKRDIQDAKQQAGADLLESLLPVMDEIQLARQHGDLKDGPFAKIAEKFEGILTKGGVERIGKVGETFDPTVHQAISHAVAELPEGVTDTTVVQVMQAGYRIGERVVRPAMVAVADPQ